MKNQVNAHTWQVGDLLLETGRDPEPALVAGITDQDNPAMWRPGKKRRRKVNRICFVTQTGFAPAVTATDIDRFFTFTRRTDLACQYQTRSQVQLDYTRGVFAGVFKRVGETGQEQMHMWPLVLLND